MSEFGIKIKNFQAGSIYEVDNGVRDTYDSKDAMLTNSLFSDYLREIGIEVWKEESTRDIVCLEFDYGGASYEDTVARINKKIKEIPKDKKLKTDEERQERLDRLNQLLVKAAERKDLYKKKSKQDIRKQYYVDGVSITYNTYNKKGEVIKKQTIRYQMLFRTPGKAKKGSCMFINEKFYEKAREFLYMGIKLPQKNSPIVEMGAYSSLITSSIVGKVQIPPENILVLQDVDAFFETKVISVETDENKHCVAVPVDNYRLKNTLFDGQALIDSSIFPDWGDGYILLRHHLCKMAAFKAHIQKFMMDRFGDEYETAKVTDMFGREMFVKDIKLVTTDNAMKYLKFGVSYDYWAEWVRKNDSMFGIVKTAHPSKLGDVQQMSYQMINALDMNTMSSVVQTSLDYITKLKSDDGTFLQYLRGNANFSNDFEVLVALVDHNRDFIRSEYFRDRKKEIVRSYVDNFKTGKIIQDADNLVIVGSPYAMLLYAAGDDALLDDTFQKEPDAIQCWTGRFSDGEYLAGFRNPFNSRNNLAAYHNVYDERFGRYFDFGKQIIAVNMIETDTQERNNGLTYWAGSAETQFKN